MKKSILLTSILASLLVGCGSQDKGSIEKANLLLENNLVSDAKREFIQIITSSGSKDEEATAYYQLGTLSFEDNNIEGALNTWKKLVAEYPNSPEAEQVKDNIQELTQIVGETSKESINNAIAASYIKNGDFWSEDKKTIFTIDSSWIPKVESSIKWYDKVITEFPKSVASKVAYKKKLRTILGWKDIGQYGSKYGIRGDFEKYIPLLLSAFKSFEEDHPTDSSLQAFRYQIAQSYWNNRRWNETRIWLNKIIEKSNDDDTFYKDLAERRLNKVEY